MKLKYSFALAAAAFAVGAFAQDKESPAAEANSVAELGIKVPNKVKTQWFYTLPLCFRVEGAGGEVLVPQSSGWKAIEEGRFYPLGSSYRAMNGGNLVIAFGKECSVTIADGASFSTQEQLLGDGKRTIVLTGGTVSVALASNLEAGRFFVTTPSFTVVNPLGESKYEYRSKPDGFEVDIRCVTGTLEVEGRHFKFPMLNAADMLTIRSEHDNLQTILSCKNGDFFVQLDRGIVSREDVQDDGSIKTVFEPAILDWPMTTPSRVQISRAVPAIGSRMSVTMMTFDAFGELKNNFAFAEGRAEVNTGELIVQPKETTGDADKRAEEVTEEVAEVEEESTEETSEPSETESTESSESDDGESEELGEDDDF